MAERGHRERAPQRLCPWSVRRPGREHISVCRGREAARWRRGVRTPLPKEPDLGAVSASPSPGQPARMPRFTEKLGEASLKSKGIRGLSRGK